jgi:GNAT superfamily N-acetyltransferase
MCHRTPGNLQFDGLARPIACAAFWHHSYGMSIRRAGAEDAMGIAIVHVRSWQAAYCGLVPQDYLDSLEAEQRRPAWERTLDAAEWPRAGTLVAEEGQDVVGFASICPARDDGEEPTSVGELAAIYLLPEAWGKGLGRELMMSAVSALSDAGFGEATLWVLDTNSRARRFYEAARWHADGAVKQDGGRGFVLNEVRYRRPLP